jgi:uncharacterized membrane protein (UPF0127 family)
MIATSVRPCHSPLLLALLLLVGCDHGSGSTAGGLPTTRMTIGSKTFTLEIADTQDTRTYGLMRRDSMPDDHGMIFVFNQEAPLGFWMKNTRIPLDIIYLNAAGQVVSVKQMKAYDQSSVPSDGPAQYAIELNKGAATAAGAKAGMTLKLPEGLKSKD